MEVWICTVSVGPPTETVEQPREVWIWIVPVRMLVKRRESYSESYVSAAPQKRWTNEVQVWIWIVSVGRPTEMVETMKEVWIRTVSVGMLEKRMVLL